MKRLCFTLLGILCLACTLRVFASPQNAGAAQKAGKSAETGKTVTDPGERAFQENCGRCHNPPESLSPREVKAVLQHMRVRANLTAKDEQLILKYLAP
jgi:cytochrome c5